MLLQVFGFLHMSFADVLDVLMVATIIFFVFKWIRGSSAMNIFIAILLLMVTMVVVEALGMRLMSTILGTFIDVGVIALLVIFQPEVRHFLMRIGHRGNLARWNILRKFVHTEDGLMDSGVVNEVAEACRQMSQDKTGALIVLPHTNSLDYIIETGDKIDANVNRRLILNLFFKNSPLHDGAVIISEGRIMAARCTLPITERTDIPPNLGMRHKAAIGISEESDCDVIVVSEETGGISFVNGGNLQDIKNVNELKLQLSSSFNTQKKEANG